MLVYIASNGVNGKHYVGATVRDSLQQRMNEHRSRAIAGAKTPFAKAIRKYGWRVFHWDVLGNCNDHFVLEALEKFWIAVFDSQVEGKRGYNRTAGGAGTLRISVSKETRLKLSAAGLGRVKTPQTLARLSASLKGRPPSESCRLAAQAVPWTEERRKAASDLRIGKKQGPHKPESRAKMSAARRGKGVKVNESEHATIVSRRTAGESLSSIGRSYGVTASCIFYLCKRLPT